MIPRQDTRRTPSGADRIQHGACLVVVCLAGACSGPSNGGPSEPVEIVFRLENVGTPQSVSCGEVSPLFAPGIYVIHTGGTPIFEVGMPDRGLGLEALAEDGDPNPLWENLDVGGDIVHVGIFDMPDGTYESAAIGPGRAFSFTLQARPGDRLSLAGMYAESNDLFVATPPEGIALFDDDGTVTASNQSRLLELYDAGTEVNEEPGCGPNQAPRQAGPDTGPSEMEPVRPAAETGDGFSYPDPGTFLNFTLMEQGT